EHRSTWPFSGFLSWGLPYPPDRNSSPRSATRVLNSLAMDDGPTVQQLVEAANTGDRTARARLFERLYGELHRLAQRAVSANHAPLSATTLLHEVYLDVSTREGVAFADRSRFMAYAARAMRGLIIDRWRNRLAQKRGGGFEFTSLGNDTSIPEPPR